MSPKAKIAIPVVVVALALIIAALMTVLGGRVITSIGDRVEQDTVQSVGSSQELSRIVAKALRSQNSFANRVKEGLGLFRDEMQSLGGLDDMAMPVEEMGRPGVAGDGDAAAQSTAQSEFSTTNVQVEGVDEADIIKTDGRYIYHIKRDDIYGGTGRLVIVDAVPGNDMSIVSNIDFPDEFSPQDIYVADGQLVVVGHDMMDFPVADEPVTNDPVTDEPVDPQDDPTRTISPGSDQVEPGIAEPGVAAEPDMMTMPAPGYGVGSVRVHVYDLSDIEAPELVRETAVEGQVVSTRRIGDTLYVIASSPMAIPMAYREEADQWFGNSDDLPEIETPGVVDSAVGEEPFRVAYSDVQYATGQVGGNYITVAGISLADVDEPATITSVLGSAENVFSTAENMYVSFTQYSNFGGNERTKIYRFALDSGAIEHTGVGTVAGHLLNQFSMDEHEGNLRVVTTESGFEEAKNHLFVLGDEMQVVGSLEGFGKTENVMSARFIGDRAYVVTFRQTDPFFVIDVSDPSDPEILGELKIPGYSSYLHPYDENHVIGFGRDASDTGVQQGLKMALFDVSDVSDPKEVAKEIIGDAGTDSELLYNHRALLFDRERELLVFPVTINNFGQGIGGIEPQIQFEEGTPPEGGVSSEGSLPPEDIAAQPEIYYGPEFQGAYVYKINSDTGFQQQARLTHYSGDERPSEYMYGAGDGSVVNKDIQRALYIDDTLYTVSQGMIMANELGSLDVEGTLEIPSDK